MANAIPPLPKMIALRTWHQLIDKPHKWLNHAPMTHIASLTAMDLAGQAKTTVDDVQHVTQIDRSNATSKDWQQWNKMARP